MNIESQQRHGGIEQPTQALLDLVEADRARQSAQIIDTASSQAATLRSQARAQARERLRQAFAEQRRLLHERVAAAQARLVTQRRLHGQQRNAALLQRARQQLPGDLLARWQQPATRAAWLVQVLAAARTHLPPDGWRILHAPDWPAAEQQALARTLAVETGVAPKFEADARIAGGLKIVAGGNVIDGTLDGLLADRSSLEARLLRLLENGS